MRDMDYRVYNAKINYKARGCNAEKGFGYSEEK